MTNKEVVQAFLGQKCTEGSNTGHSLYFAGKIMYSYGKHFTLAQFEDDGSLTVTTRIFSMTTSKQTSLVAGTAAVSGIALNRAEL